MTNISNSHRKHNWLDGLAISLSAACAVHCLVLPLLIVAMPAWTCWLNLPEELHVWMLLGAFPLSSLVLFTAARLNHKAWWVFWTGMLGLGLMIIGTIVEGSIGGPWLTVAGAMLLVVAHVSNWRGRAHCRA